MADCKEKRNREGERGPHTERERERSTGHVRFAGRGEAGPGTVWVGERARARLLGGGKRAEQRLHSLWSRSCLHGTYWQLSHTMPYFFQRIPHALHSGMSLPMSRHSGVLVHPQHAHCFVLRPRVPAAAATAASALACEYAAADAAGLARLRGLAGAGVEEGVMGAEAGISASSALSGSSAGTYMSASSAFASSPYSDSLSESPRTERSGDSKDCSGDAGATTVAGRGGGRAAAAAVATAAKGAPADARPPLPNTTSEDTSGE